MEHYQPSARSTIKRSSKRAHYDKETVYAILDAGFLCHAGFAAGPQPYVIPTAYGREEDTLYLHGAVANHMLSHLEQGLSACITVTHLDGLVLARSAFHHSINYRSAVLFGTAKPVTDEAQKMHALKIISDQMLKGRWEEVREPSAKELKITKVLAFQIEEASAKVRSGGPVDEEEDYALPIWAGVVPLHTIAQPAETDVNARQELPVAASVRQLLQ